MLVSIFAGALSDRRYKKRTMLWCGSFAALCTLGVLLLLRAGWPQIWHLYGLNALNGLVNPIQQPAADVATSLLTPARLYQRAGGVRSSPNSLANILTPGLATALARRG